MFFFVMRCRIFLESSYTVSCCLSRAPLRKEVFSAQPDTPAQIKTEKNPPLRRARGKGLQGEQERSSWTPGVPLGQQPRCAGVSRGLDAAADGHLGIQESDGSLNPQQPEVLASHVSFAGNRNFWLHQSGRRVKDAGARLLL